MSTWGKARGEKAQAQLPQGQKSTPSPGVPLLSSSPRLGQAEWGHPFRYSRANLPCRSCALGQSMAQAQLPHPARVSVCAAHGHRETVPARETIPARPSLPAITLIMPSLYIQTLQAAPFPSQSNTMPAESSLRQFWRFIISLAYICIKTYLIYISIKPEAHVGLLPRTISPLDT